MNIPKYMTGKEIEIFTFDGNESFAGGTGVTFSFLTRASPISRSL